MKKILLFVILIMTSISTIAQVKLHPDLTANNSIEYYDISPDGSTVVYVADLDTDDVFELYSVSTLGGTSTKLNGTLVADGDVLFNALSRFQISADSQTVVYAADQDTDGTAELYSVPINGGTVTKLNGTQAGVNGVKSFQLSPNGQTVVYVANELDQFDDELYSVPISGGSSTKISQADIGIGDVFTTFHISPDSQWVVYVVDAETNNVNELYSVPINGGTINKMNGTLVSGGDVLFEKVYISPDSQRVVYIADQDTNFVDEVYSTPITGGTNVKLNLALTSSSEDVDGVFISPDGQKVVYVAGNSINQSYEIFSADIDGSSAIKLNGSEIDDDNPISLRRSVQISPDNQTVIYFVNTTTDNVATVELFSVPIDGSSNPLRISGELNSFEFGVFEAVMTPNGQNVVYLSEEEGGVNADIELYVVPIGGGTITKLNANLVAGGNVTHFIIDPNGDRVFYRADQDTNEVFELYEVPIDGSTDAVKVNGNLTANGDVSFDYSSDNSSSFDGVQINFDGSQVIYIADQDINEVFELYSVDYSVPLSTDEFSDNSIHMFNDRDGNIHIKGIDNGKTTIEVYSILGSRVFQTSFEASGNDLVSTSNMSTGLYIVRVTDEKNRSVSKKMVFTK